MSMQYVSNVEKGKATGAFVPKSVMESIEHQKDKYSQKFKEINVNSAKKIEFRIVNKPVNTLFFKKNTNKIIKKEENEEVVETCSIEELEKEEHIEIVKQNKAGVSQIAKYIPLEAIFEKNSVNYSDKLGSSTIFFDISVKRIVEVLRGLDKGQQYLADCGYNAEWIFNCPPEKNMLVCVDNEYGGAWIPYVVMYRAEYDQCKYVKENSQGREFSQDYDESYK